MQAFAEYNDTVRQLAEAKELLRESDGEGLQFLFEFTVCFSAWVMLTQTLIQE